MSSVCIRVFKALQATIILAGISCACSKLVIFIGSFGF